MNLELLRPFDKEAAKRGEAIYYLIDTHVESVTFIAEAGTDGDHALRDSDGNCMFASNEFLRMKPLAWVDEEPVYRGDDLWCVNGFFVTIVAKTVTGYFLTADGDTVGLYSLLWTKPEPKGDWLSKTIDAVTAQLPPKKTRTVKFLGLMTQLGALVLVSEDSHLRGCVWSESKRVPGADVTYEVEQ